MGEAAHFPVACAADFSEVDGLGRAAVPGHEGILEKCWVGAGSCLFVKGRRHLYEGDMEAPERLVAFLAELGYENLLVTSASGALNPTLSPGDLLLVREVVDFQWGRLRRRRRSGPGGQAPPSAEGEGEADRTVRERGERGAGAEPDLAFTVLVKDAACRCGLALAEGVLAALPGPAYETPAEVEALRLAGADAVTMSAAPELRRARAVGMRAAALAVVTNLATSSLPHEHSDVLDAAGRTAGKVKRLVEGLVALLES